VEKKRDFVIAMLNCKKIKRDFVDDGKKEEKGNEDDRMTGSSLHRMAWNCLLQRKRSILLLPLPLLLPLILLLNNSSRCRCSREVVFGAWDC
jgi:hypothetical protein